MYLNLGQNGNDILHLKIVRVTNEIKGSQTSFIESGKYFLMRQ